MPFIAYVLAALLAISGASAVNIGKSDEAVKASTHEVAAASMRVMAGVAQEYIKAHPTKEGEVSVTELAAYTPTWFVGDRRIKVMGHAGRAYVYIAPENGNRIPVNAVMAGGDAPATLGIASAGKLVSSMAGTVLLDIPASIPDGSVVYVL